MTNLKQWRDDLGLSQPQMSRYLRVSPHTYRKWEQGQHDYPAATQALIDLLQQLEALSVPACTVIEDRLTGCRNP